jgi:hypothetical protein
MTGLREKRHGNYFGNAGNKEKDGRDYARSSKTARILEEDRFTKYLDRR